MKNLKTITVKTEPPKKKSSFYEMKKKLLQKICSNLEKQHKSSFGVACTFNVEIDNKSGAAFIECSFCDVKLKVKKLVESNVQQAVNTHMKRTCHKSNLTWKSLRMLKPNLFNY